MGYFDEQHHTLLAEPVGPGDHVRGPVTSDVTLVEYGDFACPFCRAAYADVKALLARMPEVLFVFRANPRSHLFRDAEPAAEAAELAAAQGRFWEMHDRLFESEGVSRAELVTAARAVGLDVAAFERDLDAGAVRAAVRAQEVSGWHSHVLSRPSRPLAGGGGRLRGDDRAVVGAEAQDPPHGRGGEADAVTDAEGPPLPVLGVARR